MKQRLLLTIVALLAGVQAWAMDFEVDGLRYWSYDETDEVSVYRGSCSGDVVIPSSVTYEGMTYRVTSIDGGGFHDCSSLTSVVIPSSVTWIGSSAFSGCSNLTSVVIPSSVTSIYDEAFSGCSSLTYNEYDNGLYLGNTENPYLLLMKAKNADITSCSIHSSTKSIHSFAFEDCSSLTSVVIPSGVTVIGSYAFINCSSLTSVTIPSSVNHMANVSGAFSGCNVTRIDYTGSLEEWCNKQWSPTVISHSYDLYINGKKVEGELVIPSSVTEIGDYAFSGCNSLTSVEIPSSVTSIDISAFEDCDGLTSVTISEGVTSIGSDAFDGCKNLTSVTIPSTVTVIGSSAFPNPYYDECKLNTITLLTKTNQPALTILGDYTVSYFHSKGYAAVYVADGLLPFYEWFWGGFYNFIEIGDVPNVINGEGGIASIVKVYNNKVDINVDLEEGYSVSEIKVNGNVVYPASSGNKALSADVSVIKKSETSFTLVGVTADDTIEVAYNKSTPTPVGVIEMQREVKGIYDIYGRKLSAPQRGINIIDGKKVIVK
ncbi:MAG: leucine-rich repeat domain-containing protein [Bacteroidales bacterium]|nr:leucine-rich repeat domain-containing protein [Bacteroidales bacterium]